MDYERIVSSAKEQGKIKGMIVEKYDWTEKGQKLAGKVMGIKQCPSEQPGKFFNVYTIETTKGLIQTSLGGSVDDLFNAVSPIDRIFEFEYNGKVKTAKKRLRHDFIINEIIDDAR